MTNREKIYENVKALVKMNKEKLSDVEKEIGITVGYLSKAKSLSIDKIEMLADHFGVTIDELIHDDYWSKYRKEFAVSELKDAIDRAKKCMTCKEIIDFAKEWVGDENT